MGERVTPAESQTLVIGLVATGVAFGLWLVVIAWREIRGWRKNATFSQVLTKIWAAQPWVILLPSVVCAFILGFFFGHWFGVPGEYLTQIRDAIGGR